MLAERKKALRMLTDRQLWPLWVGRLVEQSASWLFLLLLLNAAWAQTRDPQVVGWVLTARFFPRVVISAFHGVPWLGLLRFVVPVLIVAQAAVAVWIGMVVSLPARAIGSTALWLILGGSIVGTIAALAGGAERTFLTHRLDRRRSGGGALLWATIDRTGMLIGAIAAAGLVLTEVASHRPLVTAAFIGLTFVVAAVLLLIGLGGRSPGTAIPPRHPDEPIGPFDRSWLVPYAAAFGGGAVASAMLAAAIFFRPGHLASSPVSFVLIAAIGAGMLVGPLPVPRVLLRVSAPILALAASIVSAAAAITAFLSGTLVVAVPALFVLGMAAVTQNSVRAIALRRLTSVANYSSVTRGSVVALALGQLAGAIMFALGSESLRPIGVLVAVAVGHVVLVGLALLGSGLRASLRIGGLSSLPIRSVVHRLSWDTRPAASVAEFAGAEPRAQRLARWIGEQVTLQRLKVILPISRKEYDIYRPDDASRDRLFEAGHADREKQMPYWAKVWPSGVALADVVVERKDEVANKHVLELGAGLGVTAAAVLESGGELVTADYSALPLAHCRLSAVVNTGRAPRATCFNWRHEVEIEAATRQPDFRDRFPLILAADVLYEGRDAVPLMNVIERLLTADGSLWLAEPVRRTAQRFLDSAAELGWDTESRQVQAEWPDATDGPVNLHFLTRSAEPDRLIGDLGGFRI